MIIVGLSFVEDDNLVTGDVGEYGCLYFDEGEGADDISVIADPTAFPLLGRWELCSGASEFDSFLRGVVDVGETLIGKIVAEGAAVECRRE